MMRTESCEDSTWVGYGSDLSGIMQGAAHRTYHLPRIGVGDLYAATFDKPRPEFFKVASSHAVERIIRQFCLMAGRILQEASHGVQNPELTRRNTPATLKQRRDFGQNQRCSCQIIQNRVSIQQRYQGLRLCNQALI